MFGFKIQVVIKIGFNGAEWAVNKLHSELHASERKHGWVWFFLLDKARTGLYALRMRFILLNILLFSPIAQANTFTAYKVEMKVDMATKTIVGTTTITGQFKDTVKFPLKSLTVDSVSTNSKVLEYKTNNKQLSITTNNTTQIEIKYHGTPSGLVFGEDYVYSDFDTCGWMICNEDPTNKATFELQLETPKDFKVIANGNYVSQSKSWREEKPFSTYLFGFAMGKFNSGEIKYENKKVAILFKGQEIEPLQVMGTTILMIHFYKDKSGLDLPVNTYTQVIVPNKEAQEKNGFAIIGQDYIKPLVQNPKDDWAIAHELAHLWWGNLLTCKGWKHFWLNEGITVFMTAAWKQKQWGESEYQREIALAKTRYDTAIKAGWDKKLTFEGEYPSLQIKRAIVYSKAMLFMVELRRLVGDDAFWKGMREFVAGGGRLVESEDFRSAMEKASGKDLSKIFEEWVY